MSSAVLAAEVAGLTEGLYPPLLEEEGLEDQCVCGDLEGAQAKEVWPVDSI